MKISETLHKNFIRQRLKFDKNLRVTHGEESGATHARSYLYKTECLITENKLFFSNLRFHQQPT